MSSAGLPPDGSIDTFATDALLDHAKGTLAAFRGQTPTTHDALTGLRGNGVYSAPALAGNALLSPNDNRPDDVALIRTAWQTRPARINAGDAPTFSYHGLQAPPQSAAALDDLRRQQAQFAAATRGPGFAGQLQDAISGAVIVPGVGASGSVSAGLNLSTQHLSDDGLTGQVQLAGGKGHGYFVGGGDSAAVSVANATPSTLFTLNLAPYAEGDIGVGPVSGTVSGSRDAEGNWNLSGARATAGPAAGVGGFAGYAGSLTGTFTPRTLWEAIKNHHFLTVPKSN
jgi:hypothetical protein